MPASNLNNEALTKNLKMAVYKKNLKYEIFRF
jgi:hypothetical protein